MMLYTLTPPSDPADRVLFFPSFEAALDALGGRADRRLFRVAVRVDECRRRLIPVDPNTEGVDPLWTTPAQVHGDGTVTARAPIPAALYVGECSG